MGCCAAFTDLENFPCVRSSLSIYYLDDTHDSTFYMASSCQSWAIIAAITTVSCALLYRIRSSSQSREQPTDVTEKPESASAMGCGSSQQPAAEPETPTVGVQFVCVFCSRISFTNDLRVTRTCKRYRKTSTLLLSCDSFRRFTF